MNESDANASPLVPAGGGEKIEFDWGEINWIASGALGNAEQMTFGKVVIKAGRANPAHWHPDCEEVLHLLAGRLEHDIGETTYEMSAGDTIVIPGGAEHCARSVGEADAVMLVVYPTANREVRNK